MSGKIKSFLLVTILVSSISCDHKKAVKEEVKETGLPTYVIDQYTYKFKSINRQLNLQLKQLQLLNNIYNEHSEFYLPYNNSIFVLFKTNLDNKKNSFSELKEKISRSQFRMTEEEFLWSEKEINNTENIFESNKQTFDNMNMINDMRLELFQYYSIDKQDKMLVNNTKLILEFNKRLEEIR